MIATTIRTALVAALIVAGSAAHAQQARTHYYGYELTSVEGQRAVLARIQRAAKHACETNGTLNARIAAKSCTADLTAQMIASSRSPVLAMRASGKEVELASNGR